MAASDIMPYDFDGEQLRVVQIDGEPWFVVADVCRMLGIINPSNAMTRLNEDALDSTEAIDRLGRP